MMYVNTTTPERRKKNSTHEHHHRSPALQSQPRQEEESRYPASPSPQHRYEEMDYMIHRNEGPYTKQHCDGSDCEEQYMIRDQPVSLTQSTTASSEVSLQSPTQLFHFMNRHLWAQAMKHLQFHPTDASVWINSSSHRNLPLHLACLMLSTSARGAPPPPPLHFMEALVHAYPDAAAEKNSEGKLPLHLASECIDITSRYLESEGILLLLSKVYPAGLTEKDGGGKVPLQILEERGVSKMGGKIGKSGVIRYMKSLTKGRSRSESESDKHHHDDNRSDDNLNGFVTPKKTPKSTPMSDRHSRKATQSPSTSPYRGYDLLSTPAARNHGYDLISTPAKNFHAESSSSRSNIQHTRELTNDEDNRHIHASPRPSEYVLMSPPRVVSSSHSSASRHTPPPHGNNSNNALEVRLQMMEAKYAQLQREFDNLNAIHSETVSELKEQTNRADESQYRINVLSESEDGRMRLNNELNTRYDKLQSKFDSLNAIHLGTVKELSEQTKRAEENQWKIEILSQSEDSRIRVNSELKDKNNELEAQLSHQMRIQAELKEELQERTTQLQEMRTRESSLLQQLLKKLDNDEERCSKEKSDLISKEKDAISAKNILLREVAVKAIQTVGVLRKEMKLSGSYVAAKFSSQSEEELEQLLADVDLSPKSMSVSSSQQRNSDLKASDALQMLHPIIQDVQNMQKDVTNKVQKLLQSCVTTSRLIDGISGIPESDFDFEETLQALAQVMSTNIGVTQSMDTTLVDIKKISAHVASVTKQSPIEDDVVLPYNGGDCNTKALLEVLEVTQKTSKKLESLGRTISKLNFSEVNLKEEEMKKCIIAADEITKVFRLSLDHLTKDTTKIRDIAGAAMNLQSVQPRIYE